MTLEKIRDKAQALHTKTRRAMLGEIALTLLVAALAACNFAWFHDSRVHAASALAIAWSLAGQYFLNRRMWDAMLPADTALLTGLAAYRRQIERRRYLAGRFLWWSFGPVVLAIAAFVAYPLRIATRTGMLLNMLPFWALLTIWIVGVFVIRIRDQRELRREIDELNNIERANS